MIWPFARKRRGPSPAAQEAHDESLAFLKRSHALRMEAAQVSCSLRESRIQNHFAEGFRAAMGGPTA